MFALTVTVVDLTSLRGSHILLPLQLVCMILLNKQVWQQWKSLKENEELSLWEWKKKDD